MATVSTKIKGIYRKVQLTSQVNLDLDFIHNYLETAKNSPDLLEIPKEEVKEEISETKKSDAVK